MGDLSWIYLSEIFVESHILWVTRCWIYLSDIFGRYSFPVYLLSRHTFSGLSDVIYFMGYQSIFVGYIYQIYLLNSGVFYGLYQVGDNMRGILDRAREIKCWLIQN